MMERDVILFLQDWGNTHEGIRTCAQDSKLCQVRRNQDRTICKTLQQQDDASNLELKSNGIKRPYSIRKLLLMCAENTRFTYAKYLPRKKNKDNYSPTLVNIMVLCTLKPLTCWQSKTWTDRWEKCKWHCRCRCCSRCSRCRWSNSTIRLSSSLRQERQRKR